nr:glycosyltransferase family 39 protein [Candidatus Krumholzibacteria bacterium]
MAALLALTMGLRLWRLSHGLPDFLEEAMPLRQALKMWERGQGLSPEFFHYPSLTIYLNFLIIWLHAKISLGLGAAGSPADVWLMMKTDPSAIVLASRALNILADLASVWAVWRIGRAHNLRTATMAALLVTFSPTMISQSRLIVVEPIMTALLLWFLDRLIAHGRTQKRRDLILAIFLGGLAAGAKYNAGLIVFPFLVFWWRTARWQTLLRTPLCLVGAAVVFLATSPYVLIDFPAFWSAFLFESRHMATGHLGTLGQSGVGFLWRVISSGFGALGLSFALLWVFFLVKDRLQARSAEILTFSLLVPLLISVAGFRMHAVRYAVPLIPLIALGVAFGVDRILRTTRIARVSRNWVPVMVVTLVLLWPLYGGLTAARRGAESTQIQARLWLEKNLAPESVLIQEEYGPKLLTPAGKQAVTRDSCFAQVSPALATWFHTQREFRSSTLPIAVSGDMTFRVSPEEEAVPLFLHPADFGGVLYHPRLLSGLDHFITSGGVQERYQADGQRFFRQVAWYSFLENQAEVVAEFVPDATTSGPRLTIHSLHRWMAEPPLGGTATIPWWADA